jgi:Uncharacterised nucleotidyltransferase
VNWQETPEGRLVLLLCGTEERRRARADEAVALVERVRGAHLMTLLEHLRVISLVGQRLLALPAEIAPLVTEQIESSTSVARERGTAFELITLAVLAALEDAGIRALPLKGSTLARELYHDPALRSSVDVDLLVARGDLRQAIEVVHRMGWQWEADVTRDGGLPALHECLVHPTLPTVELHWRVHWYEQRFAAEALARAERAHTGEPLRMQPADGLASLILFYARDGFSGLRTPADIAAWWSSRCASFGGESPLAALAERHPALRGPLQVGSAVLDPLVGVRACRGQRLPLRWRLAAEMANPFLVGSRSQVGVNASLVDVLLAPPGDTPTSIQRELRKVSMLRRGRLADCGSLSLGLARAEHTLRVLRRWGLGLISAAVGLARGGRQTWN